MSKGNIYFHIIINILVRKDTALSRYGYAMIVNDTHLIDDGASE